MYPVLAREATEWIEMRHQEQLAQAGQDQLANLLRQPVQSKITATGRVAHPMRLAAVMVLLMVVLVVAAV